MRKILCALLMVMSMLALCACGNKIQTEDVLADLQGINGTKEYSVNEIGTNQFEIYCYDSMKSDFSDMRDDLREGIFDNASVLAGAYEDALYAGVQMEAGFNGTEPVDAYFKVYYVYIDSTGKEYTFDRNGRIN